MHCYAALSCSFAIFHVSASDSVFKKLIKLCFFSYICYCFAHTFLYKSIGYMLARNSKRAVDMDLQDRRTVVFLSRMRVAVVLIS